MATTSATAKWTDSLTDEKRDLNSKQNERKKTSPNQNTTENNENWIKKVYHYYNNWNDSHII